MPSNYIELTYGEAKELGAVLSAYYESLKTETKTTKEFKALVKALHYDVVAGYRYKQFKPVELAILKGMVRVGLENPNPALDAKVIFESLKEKIGVLDAPTTDARESEKKD